MNKNNRNNKRCGYVDKMVKVVWIKAVKTVDKYGYIFGDKIPLPLGMYFINQVDFMGVFLSTAYLFLSLSYPQLIHKGIKMRVIFL